MALGGGNFITQNKNLPGSYINFVSASQASANLADRGIAAMALELDWGVDGAVMTVTSSDFLKDSLKIFGYAYSHDKMKGLRDLFLNIKTGYFYKINSGGVKASCTSATANYTGIRGNNLKIVIEANESSTTAIPIYDVSTFLDTTKVDVQTVKSASELKKNDYVTFVSGATLSLTAGTPLSGGTNGTAADANYQMFLDKIESFSFNALGCLSESTTIRSLFATFTRRMRDEEGIKFQSVLHKHDNADYEGIVSVQNNPVGANLDDSSLVYWVTGVIAGCAVNMSNTNRLYDGEFSIDVDYTQAELESALKSGKFIFHKVGDEVRVLEDINSFVSITDVKSADFSDNQTIRVLDQIGGDIATLFNTKYLGKVPNDDAGRISLWNDIVRHHQKLQTIRAIEDFLPDQITVTQGDTKKSVVVTDYVTPTHAMGQLYMTIIVQ